MPKLYFAKGDAKDPRLEEYYQKFLDMGNVFQDYVPGKSSVRNGVFWEDNNMFHLADWPTMLSMSPISEPEGWANAPFYRPLLLHSTAVLLYKTEIRKLPYAYPVLLESESHSQ